MTVNDCLEDVKKKVGGVHQMKVTKVGGVHLMNPTTFDASLYLHIYIYISTYLRSFAILAWCLSRLRLEKADEVLGILKAQVVADLCDA